MHNKDFPPEMAGNHASNGDYGPNGKRFFSFLRKYKFYLNFENSNCKHYYSEKLRRSLVLGIVRAPCFVPPLLRCCARLSAVLNQVPILLGHPADHEYFLPSKASAFSHHPAARRTRRL
jgi:hypothetical protein